MTAAPKLATYEALLALPADVRAEVVAGAVSTLPSPRAGHARAQRSVARVIGGPYDDDDGRGGPGGWWILTEVDVELGAHDIVRPDLVGWRRERMPSPVGDERPVRVRPDWVCEILSPSNEAHDRVAKRALYRSAGVPHFWLVDPVERTLEALALEGGRWVDVGAFDETSSARVAPFEAIEIDVGRLFFPRLAPSE